MGYSSCSEHSVTNCKYIHLPDEYEDSEAPSSNVGLRKSRGPHCTWRQIHRNKYLYSVCTVWLSNVKVTDCLRTWKVICTTWILKNRYVMCIMTCSYVYVYVHAQSFCLTNTHTLNDESWMSYHSISCSRSMNRREKERQSERSVLGFSKWRRERWVTVLYSPNLKLAPTHFPGYYNMCVCVCVKQGETQVVW